MSDVQAYVLLGEFDEGIAHYDSLACPTCHDVRWKGVCHFSLFLDQEAIQTYERSIEMGCDEARINYAHSLAFVGRAEEVTRQLELVNFESLSLYDRVFYLRVKSLYDERDGRLLIALKQAEHAWRIVQGAPEFPLLAPKLLNQLGILHGRIGRAQRALWYLDRNLELSQHEDNILTLLTRVRVLSALGKSEIALATLVELGDVPEGYKAIASIRHAELAWSNGSISEAITSFRQAISFANPLAQGFEEFQASLELATLLCYFSPDLDEKSSLMQRSQVLISDRSDRVLYRFREVLIFSRTSVYTVSHTAFELLALSSQLGEMGLLHEQGLVNAHAANALRKAGQLEKCDQILGSLKALSATLQNPSLLAREWYLMPEFVPYVREKQSQLVP